MSQVSEDKVFRELKSLGIKIPKTKKIASKVSKREKHAGCSSCKVFGVPLSEQEKILLSDVLLPKFIVEATSYLRRFVKEIGLFRKAGSISRQRELRIKLEDDGTIEDSEPNDVASLLKQWLRELPEPLIPVYLHDLFLRSQNVEHDENKIRAILLCCHLLPTDHLQTLKHLMIFFSDVALNSDTNKMGNHNLAVIMSPNIFVIGTDSIDKSSGNLVQMHARVVQLLISNADKIGCFPTCTSLYLEENETLKYNDHFAIPIEVFDCSPSRCKKKRRSGPVQDLVSGIRKLVGSPNSTSPNPTRKNQDKSLLSSASRSVSKRKADSNPEQSSSTPKKLMMEANIPQDETPNCTPTSKSDFRREKSRGHSYRKAFGFLRKKEKRRQKSSKPSETKNKNSFDTPNTPSPFQEKFCLAFEEPVKAEIDSSTFSPLFPKSPFVKKSVSDCYLTPTDDVFKDLPFQTYSSSRYLGDQKIKSSPSKLKYSNESKTAVIKCKSDGLTNEFFSPKNADENNSNHALEFACNHNLTISPLLNKLNKKETTKRHSLSPVNIKDIDNINVTCERNSGSPILKDCCVALNKAKILKLNEEILQKEIISGSVNRICNNSNAVSNEYSDLILNSYNIPYVLNENNVEVYETNLYFKDASKVMDKLDVPSLQDSNQIPFLSTEIATNDCSTESLNNDKVVSKDISAFNTKIEKTVNENSSSRKFGKKTVNASVSHCPSTMNMQKNEVTRKCSLVRQEAFRIKSRASKKSVTQIKSADSIIVSSTKMKTAEPEINQNSNGQKKESHTLMTNGVKSRDKFVACDKQKLKRDSRKGSIIRGRPNAVKTELPPSDVCNHFSAESNINTSTALSSTIDNDSSIIFQMENVTLVSPNSNSAVQGTIDELENSKLTNTYVSDRNVVPKRKSRTKVHSYSDSKVYKIKKSTKGLIQKRTHSFQNLKTKMCKADKKLIPLESFNPRKSISTTIALDKENSFLSSSTNEVFEINMKTPGGNAQTPETWVSGRKFFDSESAKEEVSSKRESIAMILKNKTGHVQAKVQLYDNRRTIGTPASLKATRSGACYDSSYSNSPVSQKKQSSSVKSSNRNSNSTSQNRVKNLPPPPKFIIPDSASPKPCHPLKEVTNISGTDNVYFIHSPAKNSFKDKTPQHTLAIKPRRNSYCGHTPYKLSQVRSQSSPLLPKIVDKSFEKLHESVSRSSSLVQNFRPLSSHPGSPLFKTRSSLSIEKLRSDQLIDEWNCEM